MPPTVAMFDSHGNFATEEFKQQAREICNTQNVILKGRELDRLEDYFKYLARIKDPDDPAMVELWPSGLFEEIVNVLSTPMSQDQEGHLTLYSIALLTLNDILRSPWSRNPQAKAYLKSRVPAILREQNFAYRLPMGEEFKFKFRDSLLGIFGVVLMEFADDGLQQTLNGEILLGFAFDYYFGWTPPSQGEYSAYGARVILFDYSEEAFRRDPAPYLNRVLGRRGEKNVADRYKELATNAGKGKLLDSESSWNLLAHLITVRSLQTRLLGEAEVHMSALETAWNEMSSLPADRYWADEVARVIIISIAHIVAVIESPWKSKVIIDLMHHDSILLFGRAFFAPTDIIPWIDQIRGIFQDLSTYHEVRSLGQLELAQLQWAHVWRSLNSSQRSVTDEEQRPSREAAKQFWLGFGREALRISPERFWASLPNTSDIQACGRIKCPRFGDTWSGEWDTAVLPSYCTGCYKIIYCTVACQKLDWNDGNHKNVCKSLIATINDP
ncbi:hypothetical protein M407DRAFT_28067 [Tulasnella calospora MUT 4182]|uniref:MYND-type domain-containing protein n=1 Tax=Tulasnella calospora MUT 4182 TaxID=1051891 RepID=A0A0C3QCR9_9AGAM|nr:hypothetical protein M407DRAFT_28067 [Tulasnella calospora MUT 4182]